MFSIFLKNYKIFCFVFISFFINNTCCVIDRIPPAQIQQLEAFSIGSGIIVKWQQGSENDIKEYIIERLESGTNVSNNYVTQSTLFIDHNIVQGGIYTYTVFAVDNCGNKSPVSPPKTISIKNLTTMPNGVKIAGSLVIGENERKNNSLSVIPQLSDLSFTVKTNDNTIIKFIDANGNQTDQINGLNTNSSLTISGIKNGLAKILFYTSGANSIKIGEHYLRVGEPESIVRILRGKTTGNDIIEFIELPSGQVTKSHSFPPATFLRGSDMVETTIEKDVFGLYQAIGGETHIYRFSDGAEVHEIKYPNNNGGAGIPGVEPAIFEMNNVKYGISIDSRAQLITYNILTGQIIGSCALANSSQSTSLAIGEDVDMLIHGEEGSTTNPLTVYVQTINSEVFAASLPDLANLSYIDKLPENVQVAVDPVTMGEMAVFQDAKGNTMFVKKSNTGYNSFLRKATIKNESGTNINYDAPKPDIDIVSTVDGKFAVQLTSLGHCYVIDPRKIDPSDPQYGQALAILKAPAKTRARIGVDPIIACYDPSQPESHNMQHARVIVAYKNNSVRLFSLDGKQQWTFQSLTQYIHLNSLNPTVVNDASWQKNIDLIPGPTNNNGISESIIIRDGKYSLRIVNLADGKLLHTYMLSSKMRPVQGVDPVLTNDGRYLIDLAAKYDPKPEAQITIYGVAPPNGTDPGTFNEIIPIKKKMFPPNLDVDILVHESENWACVLDHKGTLIQFNVKTGDIISTIAPPQGTAGTINGVDPTMPKQSKYMPHPDEDWCHPQDDPGLYPPDTPPDPHLQPDPTPDSYIAPDDTHIFIPSPDFADKDNSNDNNTGNGGGAITLGPIMACKGSEFDLALICNELFECGNKTTTINIISDNSYLEGGNIISLHDGEAGTRTRVKVEESGEVLIEFQLCDDKVSIPIQILIVGIEPERLVASSPTSDGEVYKESPADCMVARCGETIRFDAYSNPKEGIEALILEPMGTYARTCNFASTPLKVQPDWHSTGDWSASPNKVYKAILKCKDNTCALQAINIFIVGFNKNELEGPDFITHGQLAIFKTSLYKFESIKCDVNGCNPNPEIVKMEDEIAWEIINPDGSPGQSSTGLSHFVIGSDTGIYTIKAIFGACELSKDLIVKPRTRTRTRKTGKGTPPRNPNPLGDPIYANNGEFAHAETDLMTIGRGIDFTWTRHYKSQILYEGPMGNNWDFSYNERIDFEDIDNDGDIDVLHNVMNSATVYKCTGNGALDYETPDGNYSRLRKNNDNTYSIRNSGGTTSIFYGQQDYPLDGLLKSITDITGNNSITFTYNSNRELIRINDTYNRPYTIEWENNLIKKLTDFKGREVIYTYYNLNDKKGSYGDLKSVRSPVITGTPNMNDFPDGKTTMYTYMAGDIHEYLRYNLLTITRPNEVNNNGEPYIINTYSTDTSDQLTFDRVITQQFGGANSTGIKAGGTNQYYYDTLNTNADPKNLSIPRYQTILVDRNGTVESLFFNSKFNLIENRVYTGYVDPTIRLADPVSSRKNAARAHFVKSIDRPGPDPDYYVTKCSFNLHGEVIGKIFPAGNHIINEFAFENDPCPLKRGSLTKRTYIADTTRAIGNTVVKTETYEYEPLSNQPSAIVTFCGNDPSYDGPDVDLLLDGPNKHKLKFLYDYQEIQNIQLVKDYANSWGIPIPSGFKLGLGDLNNDGTEGPIQCLMVKSTQPDATTLRWDGTNITNTTPLKASQTISYNKFGQIILQTDFEENATKYAYYPANDPDGDNMDIIPGNNIRTGGYLKSINQDCKSSIGRNSGTNPLPENRKEFYKYNPNGYKTEIIDGRGVVTKFIRNQIDQVVRTIYAAGIDNVVRGTAPHEESLVKPLKYVEDQYYDYNNNIVQIETENKHSGTHSQNPTLDQIYTYDILNNQLSDSIEIDENTWSVSKYRYDANENQILVIKPEGNTVEYKFDERNMLYSEKSGANDPSVASENIYTYNKNGKVRYVIDSEDNDGDGLPESSEYVYDSWDRLIKIIDAAGQETRFEYDIADNIIKQQVYGTIGGATPIRKNNPTLELLEEIHYTYNELDNLIKIDKKLFGNFKPGYETVEGKLTPNDKFVSAINEFDRMDRLISTVDDNGHKVIFGYNGMSEEILVKSEKVYGNHNLLLTEYDRAGNPYKKTEIDALPNGTTQSYETIALYDAMGQMVRITDPLGQTKYFSYDSRGNLAVESDAKGPIIGSDPTGATNLSINGIGNTTRYITNGLGQIIKVFNDLRPNGQGDGLPVFDNPVDPSSIPQNLETSYANTDGIITQQFKYDKNSRLIESYDDHNNVTKYEYDALDRTKKQIFADGTQWIFQYDKDDNLYKVIDPRGVIIQHNYDVLNRAVSTNVDLLNSPGVMGTTHRSCEFDGLDRKTRTLDNNSTAANDDHKTLLSYDALGNLISETTDGLTIHKQFDGVGNKLRVLYSDGTSLLNASYDVLNRCIDLQLVKGSSATPLTKIDYTGIGSYKIHEQHGNGLITDYNYDFNKRITGIETKKGSTPVTGRTYIYDRNNNKTKELWTRQNTTSGTKGYSYQVDSKNRLTQASPTVFNSTGQIVSQASLTNSYQWTIDGANNWTEYQKPGISEQKTYNILNQDVASSYDGNGNRKKDNEYSYVFDAFDRLIEVWDAAGNVKLETYTYNIFGNRITKSTRNANNTNTTTTYIYDGDHVIEEREGNTVIAKNYYLPSGVDQIVARENKTGTLYWYHKDGSENVIATTNINGNVLERYQYTPFGEVAFLDSSYDPILDNHGNPIIASSINNPFLFKSRLYDDTTKLYYFRERYYDPTFGRFLTRDANYDPLNVGNMYSYASLNTFSYSDPYGLSGMEFEWGGWDMFKENAKDVGLGLAIGVKNFVVGTVDAVTTPIRPWTWKEKLTSLYEAAEECNFDPLIYWRRIDKMIANSTNTEYIAMLTEAGLSLATAKAVPAIIPKTPPRVPRIPRRPRTRTRGTNPRSQQGCPNRSITCFISGTLIKTNDGFKPIEDIQAGEKIITINSDSAPNNLVIDKDWKILEVILKNEDSPSDNYKISLLRSPAWIAQNYNTQNKTVDIILEELGVEGIGNVIAIKNIEHIDTGEGRFVTGKFSHLNTDIYEMCFEEDTISIKPTGLHPFFSIDRNEWLHAKDLKKGEKIRTYDEVVTIKNLKHIPGEHRVYNFEVEGEHTYLVSDLLIYTHNGGTKANGCGKGKKKKKGKSTRVAAKTSTAGLRNEHLAGKLHPKTGVPFTKKGFPNFKNHLYKKGKADVRIKATGTRAGDFSAANKAAGYSSTPKGYTWHHHQTKGRMQLVKSSVHSKTGHTGGFSLW